MDDFFLGSDSGLIFLCRLAAAVAASYALWVSVRRDYPERNETPGRAFIALTLVAVLAVSVAHEVGAITPTTYNEWIPAAAAMTYVAHVIGALLYKRAAHFRNTYLRPNPQATTTIPQPEHEPDEPEQVIDLTKDESEPH